VSRFSPLHLQGREPYYLSRIERVSCAVCDHFFGAARQGATSPMIHEHSYLRMSPSATFPRPSHPLMHRGYFAKAGQQAGEPDARHRSAGSGGLKGDEGLSLRSTSEGSEAYPLRPTQILPLRNRQVSNVEGIGPFSGKTRAWYDVLLSACFIGCACARRIRPTGLIWDYSGSMMFQ
jgi:hypothetical protein